MHLELKNKSELLALHRVFLEAKFNNSSNDLLIQSSPIVAEIYERLSELLIEEDKQNPPKTTTGKFQTWNEWRQLEGHIQKFDEIKKKLREQFCGKWIEFNEEEQVSIITNLACPFIPSESQIKELSNHVSSL